jgi:Ca2+-binding EF-hand superfamily protein
MKQKSSWIFVLVGLGLASMAIANDDMRARSGPSFEDFDQNNDMLISADEMEAFMQSRRQDWGERKRRESQRRSRLEQADTDGDGFVNESEFNAFQEVMRRGHKGKPPGRRSPDCGKDSA